ncbi:MAG: tRNA (adenosine(37)-N6)-threonylcarbamoyltransferase complex ATPase subunit type 1 TsaE [Thermodesulfobacteriota bacterium]|nr:tRNA (adenosine(37)-N6)-threonylcarbamoyltransferase complex ATPase subunit type 1 TsaE [Thermodesulfobacteriota bacterium]
MIDEFSVCTCSAAATQQFGRELGALLAQGALVLLNGELGAGKTCLATGIARGLGIDEGIPITSPTYTLMNSYMGRLPLYHFDLYRLADGDELIDLGFEDYFQGDGVALVEWSERCPDFAADALQIDLTYVDESIRKIAIRCMDDHSMYAPLMEQLK